MGAVRVMRPLVLLLRRRSAARECAYQGLEGICLLDRGVALGGRGLGETLILLKLSGSPEGTVIVSRSLQELSVATVVTVDFQFGEGILNCRVWRQSSGNFLVKGSEELARLLLRHSSADLTSEAGSATNHSSS